MACHKWVVQPVKYPTTFLSFETQFRFQENVTGGSPLVYIHPAQSDGLYVSHDDAYAYDFTSRRIQNRTGVV